MHESFDAYHVWLGIPPDQQPPHHYRLLGIALFEQKPAVIEAAADRQMAYLRTLQSGPRAALSQQLLNEIAAAKVCLLNPAKRAEYDAWLRDELSQLEEQLPPEVDLSPQPLLFPPGFAPRDAAWSGAPAMPGTPHAGVGLPTFDPQAATGRSSVLKQRKRRGKPWGWLLSVSAGMVFFAAVVLLLTWYKVESFLVIEWPETERAGGGLLIDSRPRAVPMQGPLRLTLPPGQHEVVATRPNRPPFEKLISLAAKQELRLTINWPPTTAELAAMQSPTIVPRTDEAHTDVLRPGLWVDLLPRLTAERDFQSAQWRREGMELANESAPNASLMLPVEIFSGGYDLQCDLLRQPGDGAVAFILPLGERGCAFILGAGRAPVCGVERVGELDVQDVANPTRLVNIGFAAGRTVHVQLSVRGHDQTVQIDVTLDGRPLPRFELNLSKLSMPPRLALPMARRPGIVVEGLSLRLEEVQLRLMSGQGQILPSEVQTLALPTGGPPPAASPAGPTAGASPSPTEPPTEAAPDKSASGEAATADTSPAPPAAADAAEGHPADAAAAADKDTDAEPKPADAPDEENPFK